MDENADSETDFITFWDNLQSHGEAKHEDLLFGHVDPKDIKAASIDHGRKYESVAVEKYEALKKVSTNQSGLVVSITEPYLAASPDRLVGDSIVLEVKCPYTARDKLISPSTVPYLLHEHGVLKLKSSHDYYYQIQGQLHCTGRSIGHLVVFTFKDVKIIEVPCDHTFINNMLAKLTNFYSEHFRKSMLDKFFYKDYYKYKFDY